MTKKQKSSGISVVHSLYLMQVDLKRYLESDLDDPEVRKEAKQAVDEFTKALEKADWKIMGGEDVLESLWTIREEVAAKLEQYAKPKSKKKAA